VGALQIAFACGCGSDDLKASGVCARCDRRARLNEEHFDGLREATLKRDDNQCRACPNLERAQVVVHHRRPGRNLLRWLITLCRGCHIRVHLANWRGFGFQGLLRALWREMNPGPEQRAFVFTAPVPVQVELFPTDTDQGKDSLRSALWVETAAGIWVPQDTGRYLTAGELPLQMPS
jgi:hypothetical protein